MPLSEHEQRILAELEESLSKEDPRFAKNVRETNIYSHSGRRVRWGDGGIRGRSGDLGLLLLSFGVARPGRRRVDVRVRRGGGAQRPAVGTRVVARHHSRPGRRRPRELRSADQLTSRLVVASPSQERMTAHGDARGASPVSDCRLRASRPWRRCMLDLGGVVASRSAPPQRRASPDARDVATSASVVVGPPAVPADTRSQLLALPRHHRLGGARQNQRARGGRVRQMVECSKSRNGRFFSCRACSC